MRSKKIGPSEAERRNGGINITTAIKEVKGRVQGFKGTRVQGTAKQGAMFNVECLIFDYYLR